jgi:hypothetical protein
MGRGRAKAKQTKVARQLKYNSGGTDLDRLRAELLGDETSTQRGGTADEDSGHETDDDYDGYESYLDGDDTDDEEED